MNVLLPLLFIASILVAIPFLIHFFHRFKKVQVPFSAIFLFQNKIKQANQSIKILNTILVILRALLILLAVILLAKPLTSEEYWQWEDEKAHEKVTLILIDNSKSMGYFHHNQSLFQEAIQQVKTLIRGFPFQNPMILEKLASKASLPIKVHQDKDKMLKTLSLISLINKNLDYPDKVRALFTEIKKQKIEIKHIFVFSDFQKTDWENVVFPKKVPLILVRLGEKNPVNLAITKIITGSDIHYSNVGAKIKVFVKNFSSEKVTKYVSLYLEDQFKGKKEIRLNPEEEKKIDFKVKALLGKWTFGEAVLNFDRFPDDNRLGFSLYFKEKVKILFLSHPDFLLTKFSIKQSILNQIKKQNPHIRFYEKHEEEVDSYDLIIVNRMTLLKRNEIQILKEHIKKAKPLFIILNQHGNVYTLRKNFKKLGLNKELEVKQKEKLKKNHSLKINPNLDTSYSFYQSFSHMESFIKMNEIFKLSYTKGQYHSLLQLKNKDFLIHSFVPKKNIFLITGGVNRLNSDIIFDQWFPLIINWIYHEGLRKKLREDIDRIPSIKKVSLTESDLRAFSSMTLKKLYKRKRLLVNNDIQSWLKQAKTSASKTVMQKNSLPEKIFFIAIVVLLFCEMIISYTPGIKPKQLWG